MPRNFSPWKYSSVFFFAQFRPEISRFHVSPKWGIFFTCTVVQQVTHQKKINHWILKFCFDGYTAQILFIDLRFNNTEIIIIWHNFCMTIVINVRHKWPTSWENLFLPYANNKDVDQPAHQRILISAFVIRCLDSIISVVSTCEILSI